MGSGLGNGKRRKKRNQALLDGKELEIKICGMKVLMLSSEDWAEQSRYISALFC